MGTLRRTVAPVIVLLLLVAEVVTALVGASDIRADQRKAAAIRAEKRSVATYRAALEPIVLRVFDAVQPLQDVDDQYATPAPGQNTARDDVLAHSGALGQIAAARKGLAAVQVPTSLHHQGRSVLTSIDDLAGASRLLAAATTAKGDRTGYVAEFNVGFERLGLAEINWVDALQGVYGDALDLPAAAADRTAAHARTAPTKGDFLRRADLICARGGIDFNATGKVTTLADVTRVATRQAAIVRRVGSQLLALRSDPGSAVFVQQLHIQLKAQNAFASALLAFAAAASRSDATGYRRALAQVDAAIPTLRELSHSFGSYGATACRDYFQVDDDGTPGTGKSQLTA